VALTSFKLEGVLYDRLDTLKHVKQEGSFRWNKMRQLDRLWLVFFSFLESIRDRLTHKYEWSEQTEVVSILEYTTCVTELQSAITTLL